MAIGAVESNPLLDNIRNTNFLKQKTKDEYIRRIVAFCDEIKKDLNYCLRNPKIVVKEILKYTTEIEVGMHTADKIASCFMSVFVYNQDYKENNKDLFDSWNEEIKTHIRADITKKYDSNKPTDRQEESYVSFDKLLTVRDKMKIGQERLLLFMYTEIPPVRADYYSCFIHTKNPNLKKTNYVVLNSKESYIVLNEYKTDKTYKQIKIQIPSTLKKEIQESIAEQPRDYLFTGRDDKPYSVNTYNRWANRTLKSLFKNKMSLTDIRHSYISRRDLKIEGLSGVQKKEISQIMGHSIETQSKYNFHTWIKENPNRG
jgi:hypothetical protein